MNCNTVNYYASAPVHHCLFCDIIVHVVLGEKLFHCPYCKTIDDNIGIFSDFLSFALLHERMVSICCLNLKMLYRKEPCSVS